MNPSDKTIQDRYSYAAKQERNKGIKEHLISKAKSHSHEKKKELARKMKGKEQSREIRSKKVGHYVSGHKNYGDVYEA